MLPGGRPIHIGLAHELIHADHYQREGTVDETMVNYKVDGETHRAEVEELRTVGIAHKRSGDITENDIREEGRVSDRPLY